MLTEKKNGYNYDLLETDLRDSNWVRKPTLETLLIMIIERAMTHIVLNNFTLKILNMY